MASNKNSEFFKKLHSLVEEFVGDDYKEAQGILENEHYKDKMESYDAQITIFLFERIRRDVPLNLKSLIEQHYPILPAEEEALVCSLMMARTIKLIVPGASQAQLSTICLAFQSSLLLIMDYLKWKSERVEGDMH